MEKKDYGKTLNLPKTDFNMKANLPKREPEFIKFWNEKEVNKKANEKKEKS